MVLGNEEVVCEFGNEDVSQRVLLTETRFLFTDESEETVRSKLVTNVSFSFEELPEDRYGIYFNCGNERFGYLEVMEETLETFIREYNAVVEGSRD